MIADGGDVQTTEPSSATVPRGPRRWRIDLQRWAGLALGGSLVAVIVVELGRGGLAALADAPTQRPLFWVVFALLYLAPAVAEWVIFRRLWGFPVTGIGALLQKQVSNELVFGYAGDAQFYLWSRKRLAMDVSPFGAVKDVAILSAVAGNAITLLLMAATGPSLIEVVSGPLARAFTWSAAIIAVSSLALFAVRTRLFSLARRDLAFVFAVQVARIVACLALLALLSHMLLPGISLSWLLMLVTLRMMLSRLPLLPAKDLVFAGLVAVLFGREADIVPAMALIGGLITAVHLLVGLVATALSVVPARRAA